MIVDIGCRKFSNKCVVAKHIPISKRRVMSENDCLAGPGSAERKAVRKLSDCLAGPGSAVKEAQKVADNNYDCLAGPGSADPKNAR